MSYSATNWVDGTTPVNATNLNKLEGGVSDLSDSVDEITSDLSTRAYNRSYTGTVSELIADWSTLASLHSMLFSCYGETASFLLNGNDSSGRWAGIVLRDGSNFNFMLFSPVVSYIYVGRATTSETLTQLRRVAITSVL